MSDYIKKSCWAFQTFVDGRWVVIVYSPIKERVEDVANHPEKFQEYWKFVENNVWKISKRICRWYL